MEQHWHQLNRDVKHLHGLLHRLIEKVDQMALNIDELTSAVAREKTVVDSVVTLLTGLATRIQELVDQLTNAEGAAQAQIQAQLSTVVSDINAQADALAAAVVANTPPVPVPPTPAFSKK